MLNRGHTIATSVRALATLLLISTLAVVTFGFKSDPYLKSTRTQLMKARACLIAGEDDKAGHRNQAMAHTFAAIAEVEAAMKSSNHHARVRRGETHATTASIETTVPRSNLEQALIHLKQAKENLGAAAIDQAGHRAKALELIDKAIVAIEKAVAPRT